MSEEHFSIDPGP